MRSVCAALAPAIILVACAGAGSSAESAEGGEPIGTGIDCAHAEAFCGDGKCAVHIENGCDRPVTCQAKVESLCQLNDGPMSPSRASSEKVTQLAGIARTLEAEPQCDQGSAVVTRVEALDCV